MIESKVIELLGRKCPNYHLVAEKFAKQSFSVCVCKHCRFCTTGKTYGTPDKEGKPQRTCKRVFDDLSEIGASYGHSVVAEFGTCDAARYVEEDYANFKLDGGTVDTPTNQDQEVPPPADPDVDIPPRTCNDCGCYDPLCGTCEKHDRQEMKPDTEACADFIQDQEAAEIEGIACHRSDAEVGIEREGDVEHNIAREGED